MARCRVICSLVMLMFFGTACGGGDPDYYLSGESHCFDSRYVTYISAGSTKVVKSQEDDFYPNNINCSLALTTDWEATFNVRFTSFSLAKGDCVTLYDGITPYAAAFWKQQCSSYNGSLTFETTGQDLVIRFTADSSMTSTGFTLEVTSVLEATVYMDENCYGTEYVPRGTSAYIDSNREDYYENNVDCVVTFQTAGGSRLLVRSQSMDLAVSDSVTLFDASWKDYNGPFVTHYGNEALVFETSGSDLTVLFRTDWTGVATGFRLLVTATEHQLTCYYNQSMCLDATACYFYNQACNGFEECPDGSDEFGCDHFCSTGLSCLKPYGYYCIEPYDLCDSFEDCIGGFDESPELCNIPILVYWSSGQLAGIFIGYIIFAVIVIAATCLIQRKCKPVDE